MSNKSRNLNEIITKTVELSLQQFVNQPLNKASCVQIYSAIFNSVVEIVENSQLSLTNESVNLIAQYYYDSIMINENQGLDPNIFTERAKVENISTKELTIACVLLQGTDFGLALARVIKRRS